MRIIKLQGIDNYLIAVLIHVIVFLAFGFVAVQTPQKVREIVIDWFTPEHPEFIQENFTPVGSSANEEATNNKPAGPWEGNTGGENTAPNLSSEQKTGRSIDEPGAILNANISTSNNSGTSSSYLSGIKSQLGGGGAGSSGFELEDGGGNISILKSVLPNPPMSDYGVVKLEFKLKYDGTVDPESIIPKVMDDPVYNKSAIEALLKWRFSIKHQLSSKTYRITFIFKPE